MVARGGCFSVLCFSLAAVSQAKDAGKFSTCSAAGTSRAVYRDEGAIGWMNHENILRIPYYFAQARRMYEKGLRQQKGIDKSNNDPYIALYDAQHQVLAALDLAPHNDSVWLRAGQATTMIASLDEEGEDQKSKAVAMFAKACTMDASNIDAVIAWAKEKNPTEEKSFKKAKVDVGKKVAKWKKSGIPNPPLDSFLPTIVERLESETCAAPTVTSVETNEKVESDPKKQIQAAVASMQVKPVFPTYITHTNVIKHFGKSFVETLAKIAVTKYRKFSAEWKQKGMQDPNDINDKFFNAQQRNWPEMHQSKEWKQLHSFLHEALLEHAAKSGYPLSKKDKKGTHITMWAAVYLEDGGRHGYHVHQSSFSSCVFYAQAPAGSTPIFFIDPRGAPPTNDYEQHLGERDFEPTAPFHHNLAYFVTAGDLVCFPSWLVHRVPSHWSDTERVAIPANLQANSAWDAWLRSATLS